MSESSSDKVSQNFVSDQSELLLSESSNFLVPVD